MNDKIASYFNHEYQVAIIVLKNKEGFNLF